MLDAGVKNFRTKLNSALFIYLFFLGIFYPIVYLFELLAEREGQLIEARDKKHAENERKWKEEEDALKQQHQEIKEKR